jgi:hypothetical protein
VCSQDLRQQESALAGQEAGLAARVAGLGAREAALSEAQARLEAERKVSSTHVHKTLTMDRGCKQAGFTCPLTPVSPAVHCSGGSY